MDKLIREVQVYTDDSDIMIKQSVLFNDDDIIVLSPEQVDIVIAWLKEAKEELNGKSTG